TYERELLRHLADGGMSIDILLARHKRHPDGVPNWTIHRLPIGRGLRWPVAPFVVPRAIKRVWDGHPFDLLRAHSLRYIGPAALIARRRYRLDVPIVAHHHHLDPSWLNPLVEKRVMRAVDRVVGGSGPLRGRLEAFAGPLARDGRVIFAGYVPEAEKVDYYNMAELLLFPSALEGFGLSVAEAMSCGLPVVVSGRGSLPELVVD